MDVCGCRDYDVAVFGGEKKIFSQLRVLIYIIDYRYRYRYIDRKMCSLIFVIY